MSAAVQAVLLSVMLAIKIFSLSCSCIWYWMQKVYNQTFHSSCHGGARHFKYTAAQCEVIATLIWTQCKLQPTTNVAEYVLLVHFYTGI